MRKILEYLDRRIFYIFWLYLVLALWSTAGVVWFATEFQTFNCYIGDYTIMEIQLVGLQFASVLSAFLIIDAFTKGK